MRRASLGVAVGLFALSPAATADFLIPTAWDRADPFTTYQQWETFSSPAGPTPPNTPPVVPAAPHNPNGTANVVDTSGQSFATSGGNLYSPSAATHIQVSVPEHNLGPDYLTTVLFQTRTQGTEAIYDGPNGYRLTYTDGTGSHTLLPARQAEQARQPLGGFGGALVDYAAVFELPASVATFTLFVDASGSSMSLDRVAVDTIVTRATAAAPQLPGMDETTGFAPQPVPEPAALGALAAIAGVILPRRRRLA